MTDLEMVEYVRQQLNRAPEVRDDAAALLRQLSDRLERSARREAHLDALINTPRTDVFFEAVVTEAAHQVERWGVDHDAGKRPEDWITLFMYLLGKAAKAHFDGDQAKLEHHVITTAAVALNWWRRMHGIDYSMRPGIGPRE